MSDAADRKIPNARRRAYRVQINLLPDGVAGPEWTIEYRPIKAIHANGDVVLARPFSDMYKKKFGAGALGVLFYTSPEQALAGFADDARRRIAAAQRSIDLANQQIRWAQRELRQGAHAVDHDEGDELLIVVSPIHRNR